jgi:pyrroloquinoline quinone biosynthesis protein E
VSLPAPPLALLAEVTHRCPLQCPYCSNPLALERASAELATDDWKRVLDQAADLGVLQVHFSGGEPMARRDLAALVRHAAQAGLYSNLITSGVMITPTTLGALVEAGVDHVQLSFQDSEIEGAERIGGYRGGQAKKIEAARLIKAAGLPLTTNFVVHRQNLERLEAMIELGEALGSGRMEIAHAQYYGWGLLNRDALLPSRAQLDRATETVEAARARLKGRVTIDYVVPDYHAARPKACMSGWGNRFINISPAGKALPCHAAETLPDMVFPSVREMSLADVWNHSDAFQRFRGVDWMPEPCRGCDRREIDWGGCRCQAFALTGEAAATDPACEKSPDHHKVLEAVGAARSEAGWVPRR